MASERPRGAGLPRDSRENVFRPTGGQGERLTGLVRPGAYTAAGLLIGLALGFLLWGRAAPRGFVRSYPDGARVRVARVVDGDTIVLDDGLHVRYRGCDSPEVFRFLRDPEPLAEAASSLNRELVEGAWVRLRFAPPGAAALDAHGRVLADVRLDSPVWAGSETIAERLVREGLARATAVEGDRALQGRLREAELEARRSLRGIWAARETPHEAPFVASRRGRLVHRRECIYAQRLAPATALRFETLEAALEAGKLRCPTCFDLGPGAQETPDTEPDAAPAPGTADPQAPVE